jgi:hypothetical protein
MIIIYLSRHSTSLFDLIMIIQQMDKISSEIVNQIDGIINEINTITIAVGLNWMTYITMVSSLNTKISGLK